MSCTAAPAENDQRVFPELHVRDEARYEHFEIRICGANSGAIHQLLGGALASGNGGMGAPLEPQRARACGEADADSPEMERYRPGLR
jgi:hypothetical protein